MVAGAVAGPFFCTGVGPSTCSVASPSSPVLDSGPARGRPGGEVVGEGAEVLGLESLEDCLGQRLYNNCAHNSLGVTWRSRRAQASSSSARRSLQTKLAKTYETFGSDCSVLLFTGLTTP